MLKNLCKKIVVIIALTPMYLWADDSLCANQSYQSLFAQCETSDDACISIIKNNCLANSPQTASLQMAQITDSLAQQYTMQVLTGSNVGASAPVGAQVMSDSMNTVNQVSSSKSAQEQAQAAPVVSEQQPKSNNKTNYWF